MEERLCGWSQTYKIVIKICGGGDGMCTVYIIQYTVYSILCTSYDGCMLYGSRKEDTRIRGYNPAEMENMRRTLH